MPANFPPIPQTPSTSISSLLLQDCKIRALYMTGQSQRLSELTKFPVFVKEGIQGHFPAQMQLRTKCN